MTRGRTAGDGGPGLDFRFMKKFLLAGVVPVLVLLSCAVTGPGGKTSFIAIPTSQEVAIGAGMAEQVETTETVLQDSLWQAYLNEVGQRIVAVCDRQDIEYRFTIIESDQVNAFAAPGGYIYLYTGLLRQMDSESEMAAVLAHEISHVVARHGVRRLQAVLGVAAAYNLVFSGQDVGPLIDGAINVGMGLVFSSYSRDNEREADRFGIFYMVEAGYDPNGVVGMFTKLAALGDAGSGDVFEKLSRSHPATQERISNASNQIREMQPLAPDLISGEDRYQRMLVRF